MNVTCKDRDRIFEDGTAAEWTALEGHAATCVSCGEELRAWKSLSLAAAELGDYGRGPASCPGSEQPLAEEAEATGDRRKQGTGRSLFPNFSLSWQSAAATALVVVLRFPAGGVRGERGEPPIQQGSLLRSKAL